MKKFVKITGYTVSIVGVIAIGISTFSPISCLGTGVIIILIGMAMIWATETIY